jgi:hypothetical protein
MRLMQSDFDDVVAAMEPSMASAGNSAPGGIERRHAVRVAVSGNISAWIVERGKLSPFVASVQNISLVGLQMISQCPLAPGRELILVLPRRSGPPLHYCAVVSRCAGQSRTHCGLEFCGPAPQEAVQAIQSRPPVAKNTAAA